MAMLSEHGHQRRRRDEEARRGTAAAEDRGWRSDERQRRRRACRFGSAWPLRPPRSNEPTDRTDDPVRMYLREMGSVELLSREGEIAIAKRIEAGRETMIAGLCESPLTFQAIIIWRDELDRGQGTLLREIIDLEATYAGPDAKLRRSSRALRRSRPTARLPRKRKRTAARGGEDDA